MRPKLPAGWSDALKVLLQRAWAQNPNDRPPFDELAKELEALHKGAQERSHAEGTTVAKELGLAEGPAGGGGPAAGQAKAVPGSRSQQPPAAASQPPKPAKHVRARAGAPG